MEEASTNNAKLIEKPEWFGSGSAAKSYFLSVFLVELPIIVAISFIIYHENGFDLENFQINHLTLGVLLLNILNGFILLFRSPSGFMTIGFLANIFLIGLSGYQLNITARNAALFNSNEAIWGLSLAVNIFGIFVGFFLLGTIISLAYLLLYSGNASKAHLYS